VLCYAVGGRRRRRRRRRRCLPLRPPQRHRYPQQRPLDFSAVAGRFFFFYVIHLQNAQARYQRCRHHLKMPRENV